MMYYSNDYLAHYGVQGMRWGQHIMAKYNSAKEGYYKKKEARYAKSENDRRTRPFETRRGQNIRVNSEKREAANRVKYYGGTHAAKAAIKDETVRKIAKTAVVGIGVTAAASCGASILSQVLFNASIPTASNLYLATNQAGLLTTAAKSIGVANRGARQYAYTNDSEHNKIKMVD